MASISHIIGWPKHRLEEFGLYNGTRIQMFHSGNPCIFRIGTNKVCLRTNDSLHIFVELEGE